MPIQINTTVIIVGAGPAGAGVSFFLSKYEIPHIVIEKDFFPRDKVCGDACSGKTALVIRRANPDWIQEIFQLASQYLPSWGITFIAPNTKPVDIPFYLKKEKDAKPPGFTVPRLVFDNFLFSKMKSTFCTIFQNAIINKIEKATTFEPCNNIVVKFVVENTEYEITAPLIIGADGDKGIVRKTFLNLDTNPKSYAIGLRAYYEGVEGLHVENFLELHFLKELLPGYFWIFPLPNGQVNIGLGILSEVVRKKKINLREVLQSIIQNNPKIAPRFKNAKLVDKVVGWGLPLAMEEQPISGNHFLLTGDAACLVDPFSGEGIGNALYSGMLAAAAVKEALEKQDFSAVFFKTNYDKVVYKRLGDEFKISATMLKLCNYPWLFNLVVNKAIKSKSLRETITSMFTNLDLRGLLSKPSFYFKILINK